MAPVTTKRLKRPRDDENAHTPVHAVDECVLKKDRKSRAFGRSPFHALQLRAHPSKPADYPGDGGGRHDKALVADGYGASNRRMGSVALC